MNLIADKLFAQAIKSGLANYFENGSEQYDKVHLDMWSGSITLENLKIKKNILDLLNIPLKLLICSLGRLHLTIPWGHLGEEPIRIEIDGVCVLMEPNYNLSFDSKSMASQLQKQARLVNANFLVSNIGGMGPQEPSEFFQSFKELSLSFLMNSVLSKIINNIRIDVRNVHIRYEDQLSCPLSSFCVGFMMQSLVVAPHTDLPDDDCTARSGIHEYKKLISMKRQAVYWNPLSLSSSSLCSQPLAGKLDIDVERIMLDGLFLTSNQQNNLGPQGHRFLLLPMNLEISFKTLIDRNNKSSKVTNQINVYH